MQWTEQAIRRVLDGTFTRVLADGRVVTTEVARDYLPKHGPIGGTPKGMRRPVLQYRKWSREDDQQILDRVTNRLSIPALARVMGRTEESLRGRLRTLRENGVRT